MDRGHDNPGRRLFVKRMAYVTPAILTLAAAPAYAKHGSTKPGKTQGQGHAHGRDVRTRAQNRSGRRESR